jgi:hypothetical protein
MPSNTIASTNAVKVGDDDVATEEAKVEETQMMEVDDLGQRMELMEGKHCCRTRKGAGLRKKRVVLLVGAR